MLQGLTGTIFIFCEGTIAMTVDQESMFLQRQAPQLDRCCLRILLGPRTNEAVQIYEYQRHEPSLLNKYDSAFSQFYSLMQIIQEDQPRKNVSTANRYRCGERLHKNTKSIRIQWYI